MRKEDECKYQTCQREVNRVKIFLLNLLLFSTRLIWKLLSVDLVLPMSH